MAAIAASNIRKILLGVCLCAAAGVGQFFLTGLSPARVDESRGSREAAVTATKTKRLTQTPVPRYTIATTVVLPTYEWMRATENVLFPWCGPDNRRFYSDSGDWVATRCINNSLGVYQSKDIHNNFYFTFRDVYGSKYENGNGDGRIVPVHFLHNDVFFYFSVYHPGDGGCPTYDYDQALFKLNLTTGEITEQVSPEDNNYFNFSFSSGDKFLAYFASNLGNPTLYLQDLKKHEKKMIHIDGVYSEAGAMLWSPDDDQLIFSARTGEDCYEMNYSVISLDPESLDQKVIVQRSAKMILPVRWIDSEHILVITGITPVYSILNITTGELEPESHPEAIPVE